MTNFFQSNAQAAGQVAATGSVAPVTPPVVTMPPANGAVPAAGVPALQDSPLAGFSDLWKNDATETNAAAVTGVLPTVTAEQLQHTLSKSNFLANVNPDLLQKAASGDQAAFADVINTGLRTVMIQSVLASHGLVEAGARTHGERLRTELPTMVRSSSVGDSLQSNPLYNNPAIKPVIDNVRKQLETKFPDASSREIAGMVDNYFNSLSSAFKEDATGGKNAPKTPASADDINWFEAAGIQL